MISRANAPRSIFRDFCLRWSSPILRSATMVWDTLFVWNSRYFDGLSKPGDAFLYHKRLNVRLKGGVECKWSNLRTRKVRRTP
jgi:hypothetical protein